MIGYLSFADYRTRIGSKIDTGAEGMGVMVERAVGRRRKWREEEEEEEGGMKS